VSYSEILSLRTHHKISQIKLAEFSGYSPAMISSWELRKSEPSSEQVRILTDTITKILYQKNECGIDVRKKRIQRSGKVQGDTPDKITSANNYVSRMAKVNYEETPYTSVLNSLSVKKDKRRPKAIALFSGCGGMTLGFQCAGFDVIGHVEIDETANKMYAANFPNSELLGADITKIIDDEIQSWTSRFGKIDAIIGGPPCQGFSLAGKRNPADERNELFRHYIRIVEIVRPKVFIMENVRLMTSMKDPSGALFIDRIIAGYKKLRYAVMVQRVNAKDYGVPQFRERVIIVGIDVNNIDSPFQFPQATHSIAPQQSLFNTTSPIRSFYDVTYDLPALESGEKTDDPLHWSIAHPIHVIEWLKDVPEGHSAHENEDPHLRPPSGFNTTYKRIVWNEPCSTISTNFNMISGCRNVHPSSTRSLTIREATRVQSFPDDFMFFGKWSDIRRVIGNAVPPLLAMAIADSIMAQLFK
jgi:DNA (cytosine-5)-methyltransferase 1